MARLRVPRMKLIKMCQSEFLPRLDGVEVEAVGSSKWNFGEFQATKINLMNLSCHHSDINYFSNFSTLNPRPTQYQLLCARMSSTHMRQ